jgi:hypothetical protein
VNGEDSNLQPVDFSKCVAVLCFYVRLARYWGGSGCSQRSMTTKQFAENNSGFEIVNGRITGIFGFMEDIDGKATMFPHGRASFAVESGHEKVNAVMFLRGTFY